MQKLKKADFIKKDMIFGENNKQSFLGKQFIF